MIRNVIIENKVWAQPHSLCQILKVKLIYKMCVKAKQINNANHMHILAPTVLSKDTAWDVVYLFLWSTNPI